MKLSIDNRALMADKAKLHLTKKWLVILFVYYSLVFLFGNILSLIVLIPKLVLDETIPILTFAVLGSVGMSCLGSSIFYIRKLYKSCIRSELVIDDSGAAFLSRLGTVVYYLARPLFAIGFALLIVIGLLSGLILASKESLELGQNFIYMTMFFSFYVGFLSGRFVKNLETSGNRVVKKISLLGETDE